MNSTASGFDLPLWTVAPFVGLLLSIALLPLRAPRFWRADRNKAFVSFVWSAPVLVVLLTRLPHELLISVRDYVSFMILLAALFIITGGIVLRGDIRATPEVNTAFLFAGAILANVLGTTGASMLLIRPLLQTNRERRHVGHIPIFFIMLVSNIGGSLTPLGDPPLFMGLIRGVPFTWTLRLLPVWAFMTGGVLAVFYVLDNINYRRETIRDLARDREHIVPLRLKGAWNGLWIAAAVAALFLPFPYRETVLAAAAGLSLLTTPANLRQDNRFSYAPIVEVAVLFAGIFITMVPALRLLGARGAEFGLTKPWHFFWCTGAVSSFLDNTPTYLVFLSLAQGLRLSGGAMVIGVPAAFLKAISAGAVFMGANTYIGNGPNFMVKTVAEHYHYRMPSFFGYMAYSVAVLIPLFVVVSVLFFR